MEISSTHHMDPGTQFPHRRFTETRASLVDINGDSLPDHVVQERLDDQRIILAAYFNTGSGFELTPTRLSTAITAMSRESSGDTHYAVLNATHNGRRVVIQHD